jgi:hypothetical protein
VLLQYNHMFKRKSTNPNSNIYDTLEVQNYSNDIYYSFISHLFSIMIAVTVSTNFYFLKL